MADPLPSLPSNPLGSLPENPLGAPPAPPIVGKREPLRFPTLGGRGRSGGGRSGGAPLPSLRQISQKRQQQQPTPTPAKKEKRTAPIVVQPAPRQRPTPVAPAAPATPPQARQGAVKRRTAAEVRDEARGHLSALYGPQIANHPQLGHADIRDRLMKASAADWRGHLAAVHDAALAKANERAQASQRANPGYKPSDVQASEASGMSDDERARRLRERRAVHAEHLRQVREQMDALRNPPGTGGQP